ncbi:hypothetical protein GBA52_016171 [Prunus armeniaca]|nr:hypothetical protein GBA52_016171 [Prunus armeniaca]
MVDSISTHYQKETTAASQVVANDKDLKEKARNLDINFNPTLRKNYTHDQEKVKTRRMKKKKP